MFTSFSRTSYFEPWCLFLDSMTKLLVARICINIILCLPRASDAKRDVFFILEQVVRGVTSHTEDPARNGPHFGSVSFVADILGESLYLLFSVCCGRPVWAVRGGWPGAFGPDGRCHRKMWPLPKKWPGGRIFLGKCNQGRGGRIFLRKSDRVGSASPRIIRPGGSDFPKGNPTRRVRFSSIL